MGLGISLRKLYDGRASNMNDPPSRIPINLRLACIVTILRITIRALNFLSIRTND